VEVYQLLQDKQVRGQLFATRSLVGYYSFFIDLLKAGLAYLVCSFI
jgi:hypothetical protein